MIRKLLLALALVLVPVVAFAQSTSPEAVIGYLSTTGCPPAVTVCFKPFSSQNPLNVAIAGGGSGGGAVYGPDNVGVVPTKPPLLGGYKDGSGNVQAVAPSTPLPVTESAGSLATSQATATTTASIICPARAGRRAATLQNLSTTEFYFGASGITTGTGALVTAVRGASATVPTAAAIYGITATGTATIACLETF